MSRSDTDMSSDSASQAGSDSPSFPAFSSLPPELRDEIWRNALPEHGVDFFNVHAAPNSHPGCNRSQSPPFLCLDMRRLEIEDSDEEVAMYDPSVWQARSALRQTCREARAAAAIPEDKVLSLELARPKRGLFVKAGDRQLRERTPLNPPGHGRVGTRAVGDDGEDEEMYEEDYGPEPETWVYRTVQVHAEDEMICLSVENCSFNLPAEEANNGNGEGDLEDNNLYDFGWSYDPQFYRPAKILGIRSGRYCLNLARSDSVSTRILATETPWDLLQAVTGSRLGRIIGHNETFSASMALELLHQRANNEALLEGAEPWLMLDSSTTKLDGDRLIEYDPAAQTAMRPGNRYTDDDGDFYYGEAFYDRFGDMYIHREFRGEPLQQQPRRSYPLYTRRQLVKVVPERTDLRKQYLESAVLRSPKKLHRDGARLPWNLENRGQASGGL